jgi:hypothetical protein
MSRLNSGPRDPIELVALDSALRHPCVICGQRSAVLVLLEVHPPFEVNLRYYCRAHQAEAQRAYRQASVLRAYLDAHPTASSAEAALAWREAMRGAEPPA